MQTSCKICGSENTGPYFTDEPRILQCQKCRVVFLSPEAVNYEPEQYYSEKSHYSRLPAEWEIKRGRENARNVVKFINKYIKPSGKSLLDVGSHIGLFVHEATRAGFTAEGIETNRTAVSWATEHNIPIQNYDIETFSSNKKYDVITLFHVLEHLPNPRTALGKFGGYINDGGYMIIEVPNIDSHLAKKDGPAWKFIALEHLFYFSDETLGNILKNLGFKIIVVKRRNYEIQYLNLKKIFRYFWGKPLVRKRLISKEEMAGEKEIPVDGRFIKLIFKKVLIWWINILGHEDHILIIARKI